MIARDTHACPTISDWTRLASPDPGTFVPGSVNLDPLAEALSTWRQQTLICAAPRLDNHDPTGHIAPLVSVSRLGRLDRCPRCPRIPDTLASDEGRQDNDLSVASRTSPEFLSLETRSLRGQLALSGLNLDLSISDQSMRHNRLRRTEEHHLQTPTTSEKPFRTRLGPGISYFRRDPASDPGSFEPGAGDDEYHLSNQPATTAHDTFRSAHLATR